MKGGGERRKGLQGGAERQGRRHGAWRRDREREREREINFCCTSRKAE